MDEWPVPAAKKQRRRQHRNGEHVDVFSQKEQRKLHRAVLSVKPGDQFSLSFRKIERHAIGFGDRRNQIDQKAERLCPEQVPAGNAQVPRLLFDNAVEVERA